MRLSVLVGFGLVTVALVFAESGESLFSEGFEHGLNDRWKKVEFTGETRHEVVREGTNSFLRATAASSASGLAVKLENLSATGTHLRWRWKIDHIPEGGSDSKIERFDHTARLFVAFKTLIGPPRTINYAWANEVAKNKTFEHPSSGRSRFIALESGNAQAGQWITEERDLEADWHLLFGSDKPPVIVGLGFMTDADGTKTTVTGNYDDIELVRRK